MQRFQVWFPMIGEDRSTLAGLPLDLLDQISFYLDSNSLLNFSLANKQCNSASNRHIFHTISIKFSSPDSLHDNIEKWISILAASQSFQHVNHVQVLPSILWRPYSSHHLMDCGDRPLQTWKYFFCDRDKSRPVTDDPEWLTCTEFLKRLPGLQDLTWACVEQIPSSVLAYINAKRYPHVRLHMQNFMLRSLVQPPKAEIELNSNELKLASSPCLSSLRLRHTWLDDGGYANYNEQAVIDMVAGGAPNLQDVYISREANGSGPWFLLAWQRQRRREWRRSMLYPARPIGIQGSLRTLDIYEQDSTKALMRWSEATDFSKLRDLMIYSKMDREALLWLKTSCRFTALDKLALNLGSMDPDGTPDHSSDAIDDLLLSLNPLASLRLVGSFEPRTISLVLSHHGQRLRCLLLSSTEPLSESYLAQGRADLATVPFLHSLRQSCPLLEELSLCMLRSKGDASEVAIYRAIGQIPFLRKVHLSISCPQPFTWDRTSFEEFVDLCDQDQDQDQDQDLDTNTSHLLESAFVNLAMDEKLAHSIFRIISTAKPLYTQPLECLELRINALQELGDYTTSSLIDILRYIARSWVCNRSLRDDEPHKCYSTEYDTQDVLDREEAEEWEELSTLGNSQYAQAFCQIWPKGREGDWKREWHSFALQED